jgi:tetratricopeptide (TPR) repeat protein
MAVAPLESAMAMFRAGRYDDAEAVLQRLVQAPELAGDALEGLGYIAAKRGDYHRSASLLDRAAALNPDAVDLLLYAGTVHVRAGQLRAAENWFLQCLERRPGWMPALLNLVDVHIRMRDYAAAHARVQQAQCAHPRLAAAHYAQGRVLGAEGRYSEEIAAYRRAIALKPDFVDAYVNAGVALRDLRRFDDALTMFKKALAIDPDHAGARNNRAQTNLQLGRYEHGWRDYEWRWRDGGQFHAMQGPAWRGDTSIEGKTIVVHAEQGLGDILQFVRYVAYFEGLGARVMLRVPACLVALLACRGEASDTDAAKIAPPAPSGARVLPGCVAAVVDEAAPLPAYDVHIPLLSLPRAFFKRERNVPACVPYLHAEERRVAVWRARIDTLNAQRRPTVGLVWSGSRKLEDDNRSTALAQWAPLFGLPVQFVSLQKEVPDADRDTLRQFSNLADVSGDLHDFADTAAAMCCLDLIVSIDTSAAHLAGGLGLPVWLALVHAADWRWQLDRSDSDWYPSMTLYRQPARNDWDGVIAQIAAALASRFALDVIDAPA